MFTLIDKVILVICFIGVGYVNATKYIQTLNKYEYDNIEYPYLSTGCGYFSPTEYCNTEQNTNDCGVTRWCFNNNFMNPNGDLLHYEYYPKCNSTMDKWCSNPDMAEDCGIKKWCEFFNYKVTPKFGIVMHDPVCDIEVRNWCATEENAKKCGKEIVSYCFNNNFMSPKPGKIPNGTLPNCTEPLNKWCSSPEIAASCGISSWCEYFNYKEPKWGDIIYWPNCNVPSEQWCNTPEIAKSCGMTAWCLNNNFKLPEKEMSHPEPLYTCFINDYTNYCKYPPFALGCGVAEYCERVNWTTPVWNYKNIYLECTWPSNDWCKTEEIASKCGMVAWCQDNGFISPGPEKMAFLPPPSLFPGCNANQSNWCSWGCGMMPQWCNVYNGQVPPWNSVSSCPADSTTWCDSSAIAQSCNMLPWCYNNNFQVPQPGLKKPEPLAGCKLNLMEYCSSKEAASACGFTHFCSSSGGWKKIFIKYKATERAIYTSSSVGPSLYVDQPQWTEGVCKQGKSYWCHDIITATKCDRITYCKEHVWGKSKYKWPYCTVPSNKWCDNEETAMNCGMTSWCYNNDFQTPPPNMKNPKYNTKCLVTSIEWCTSREMATECNMLEWCERNNWKVPYFNYSKFYPECKWPAPERCSTEEIASKCGMVEWCFNNDFVSPNPDTPLPTPTKSCNVPRKLWCFGNANKCGVAPYCSLNRDIIPRWGIVPRRRCHLPRSEWCTSPDTSSSCNMMKWCFENNFTPPPADMPYVAPAPNCPWKVPNWCKTEITIRNCNLTNWCKAHNNTLVEYTATNFISDY